MNAVKKIGKQYQQIKKTSAKGGLFIIMSV